MSTFGCHSCGVNLKDYADKPYESWPCASCALAKNYYHTFSTGYFDTAKAEGIEDEKARLDDETDPDYVMLGSFPLQEHEVQNPQNNPEGSGQPDIRHVLGYSGQAASTRQNQSAGF